MSCGSTYHSRDTYGRDTRGDSSLTGVRMKKAGEKMAYYFSFFGYVTVAVGVILAVLIGVMGATGSVSGGSGGALLLGVLYGGMLVMSGLSMVAVGQAGKWLLIGQGEMLERQIMFHAQMMEPQDPNASPTSYR